MLYFSLVYSITETNPNTQVVQMPASYFVLPSHIIGIIFVFTKKDVVSKNIEVCGMDHVRILLRGQIGNEDRGFDPMHTISFPVEFGDVLLASNSARCNVSYLLWQLIMLTRSLLMHQLSHTAVTRLRFLLQTVAAFEY